MARVFAHGEPTYKRQFRLTETAYKGLQEIAHIGGVSVPQLLIAIGSRKPEAFIWLTKYFTEGLDTDKMS